MGILDLHVLDIDSEKDSQLEKLQKGYSLIIGSG
jgi:hypothetical protein